MSKIIITLKEQIETSKGKTDCIICDKVISDNQTPESLIEIVKDGTKLIIPVHNVLGMDVIG